jgi:hypothetical protein
MLTAVWSRSLSCSFLLKLGRLLIEGILFGFGLFRVKCSWRISVTGDAVFPVIGYLILSKAKPVFPQVLFFNYQTTGCTLQLSAVFAEE